jgi:hypothetical protein
MPDEKVERLTQELMARMRETGHPRILGSECDVLHVPETAAAIRRKVDIMLNRAEPAREYAVSGESAQWGRCRECTRQPDDARRRRGG